MADLVAQGLTADRIADRAAAILATTEDDATESLVKTAAAIACAQDVVAANISNAQTTAYKSARPVFTGRGKGVAIQRDLEAGPLENTNRPLDVAIEGDGFFRVKIMDSAGDGTGYTRNGNFFVNDQGELVVGMADSYKVLPSIKIPFNATQIAISRNGTIDYMQAGKVNRQVAGRLTLTQFVNPQGLVLLGDSVYVETPASGKPIDSKPAKNGAGGIIQCYLESSNVDLVRERLRLVRLKAWQDAIEQAIGMLASPRGQVRGEMQKAKGR